MADDSFFVCEKSDGVRCLMYMTVENPQQPDSDPAIYLVLLTLPPNTNNGRLIERIITIIYPNCDFLRLNTMLEDRQQVVSEKINSTKKQFWTGK